MKKNIYTFNLILGTLLAVCSCNPVPKQEDVFISCDEANLKSLLAPGDSLYTLEDFKATFMTEKGNYMSDSSLYRPRATNGNGIYLFSIDTLPSDGPGIYIAGRICTDDYGGNFYKSPVIQQLIRDANGNVIEQQNLRLSVDIGSMGGMYHQGQLLLIRCNGLAIGRYANQPQLCVPSYNNNVHAQKNTEKIGWAPGRIPQARFALATKQIGVADCSKLYYEEMTMEQLNSKYLTKYADLKGTRSLDGRLVRITGIHFTGERVSNDAILPTVLGDPAKCDSTNVFAPTTDNVGYPQSRVIANATNTIKTSVSNSEYAKFAYYYIPSLISKDENNNYDFQSFDYNYFSGNVVGILGFFMDNAFYDSSIYKWSITPFDLSSFDLYHEEDGVTTYWKPIEFSKSNYK